MDVAVVGSRGMGAVKSTLYSLIGLGSVSGRAGRGVRTACAASFPPPLRCVGMCGGLSERSPCHAAGYLTHHLHCPVAICRGREQDAEQKARPPACPAPSHALQASAFGHACAAPCCAVLCMPSHAEPCCAVRAVQAKHKVVVSLDDSETSKKALEVRPFYRCCWRTPACCCRSCRRRCCCNLPAAPRPTARHKLPRSPPPLLPCSSGRWRTCWAPRTSCIWCAWHCPSHTRCVLCRESRGQHAPPHSCTVLAGRAGWPWLLALVSPGCAD